MSILIVTGIEGARNCAAVVGTQLGMEVEVAEGRKAALVALRRREFSVVVVDETMAECDPAAAEAIWERAGLAIPMQINFALSGATRLIREIRAALHRRAREQTLARRLVAELAVGSLRQRGLLSHHRQTARCGRPGRQSPPAVERALRGPRQYRRLIARRPNKFIALHAHRRGNSGSPIELLRNHNRGVACSFRVPRRQGFVAGVEVKATLRRVGQDI